jgi:RimJ/RimL family protein N-acetyltransferase
MRSLIELRAFDEADIGQLLVWVDSPEFLMQWAGPVFSFPLDEGQFRKHLLQANGPNPKLMAFKMVDRANQAMVGYLELAAIDRVDRSATLARVLVGPEGARNHGLGYQAVRAALGIAFEQLDLHRVGLGVFDFNHRAIRCYEKAGFRHEGVLRDARKVGSEYWSLCMMSILESEWMESESAI